MKRLLLIVVALVAALLVLPPLWFTLFPGEPAPPLPPPGRRVMLSSGAGVNVVEAGSGSPVVLVHGLPGTAYDWRETAAALGARRRHAIAYDRPGYGHSDPRPDGRYSLEANAADVADLLEALDLRDATVVGWSYGGATAISAAPRSKRIGRLVLVGSGGPDSPDAKPPEPSTFMRVFYSEPVMRWRRAIPPLGIGLMGAVSAAAFSDGPQPDWWLPGVRANFARWDTLMAYREEMAALGNAPGAFDPRAIAVPTLILHGDDDRLASVRIGRYLATQIPGARLVEYPGGSHMLPVTHADAIAEQIVEFSNSGR